jgi:hypothetical protein
MKGISEMLTIVLIIAITVSIGAILLSLQRKEILDATQDISNSGYDKCSSPLTSIKIKNVFASAGQNSTLRLLVQNSGYLNEPLRIVSALAYNSDGQSSNASGLPIDLDRGESAVLQTAPLKLDLCPYSFDRIVVTTDCPGIYAVFDGQPSCE